MRLIVCDDQAYWRDQLSQLIDQVLMMNEVAWRVDLATGDPQEVLDELRSHSGEAICFLDIELEGAINGLELGRQIKDLNPFHEIILVSSYSEYLPVTYQYKIGVLDYILKEDLVTMRQGVAEVLATIIQRRVQAPTLQETYVYKVGPRTQSTPLSQILAFQAGQAKAHQLVLTTTTGQYPIYARVSEVARLAPDFYQVDRSTVINLPQVTAIDSATAEIHFKTGHKIQVAQSKLADLADVIDPD